MYNWLIVFVVLVDGDYISVFSIWLIVIFKYIPGGLQGNTISFKLFLCGHRFIPFNLVSDVTHFLVGWGWLGNVGGGLTNCTNNWWVDVIPTCLHFETWMRCCYFVLNMQYELRSSRDTGVVNKAHLFSFLHDIWLRILMPVLRSHFESLALQCTNKVFQLSYLIWLSYHH